MIGTAVPAATPGPLKVKFGPALRYKSGLAGWVTTHCPTVGPEKFDSHSAAENCATFPPTPSNAMDVAGKVPPSVAMVTENCASTIFPPASSLERIAGLSWG